VAFRSCPLVIDVRHRSWDWPEAYECWWALGVGFCNIDQPQAVTGPTGCLRRQGRNAAAWFAGDAAARDDGRHAGEELTARVAVAERISNRARDTYLITHHHVRGHAALNALELRPNLSQAPTPVPLLAASPERRQLAQPAEDSATP
jgi:uncharacterized protein YecE (DUF72 family)